MSSRECEEQLKSLIEAWDLDEACLNQTDIEAIKHLMLENQMQQDTIKTQKLVIGNLSDRITKALGLIYENLFDKEDKIHYRVSTYTIDKVVDKLISVLEEDNKEE